MVANSSYCTDNNDFLPFPGWGTIGSGPGPDCWAYATTVAGKQIPPVAGQTTVSNQLPFFYASQLGPHLGKNQKVLECPKDVTERTSGKLKVNYLARLCKITSYTYNGAVAGYARKPLEATPVKGLTHKLSSFSGLDFLLWEADEQDAFNFNDAGNNPENVSEGVSQRHAGGRSISTTVNVNGGAILGRMGASAEMAKWKVFDRYRKAAGQNELKCGPAYQ
jgi:hypothetical protein